MVFEEMMLRYNELAEGSKFRVRAILKNTFDDTISAEEHQNLVTVYAQQAAMSLDKRWLELECDFAEKYLADEKCAGFLYRELIGAGKKSS